MVTIDVRAALQRERKRRDGPENDEAENASREAAALAAETAVRQGNERISRTELHGYTVGVGVIQGLYYIPEFISQDEEEALLTHIDIHPQSQWVQAQGRRMLNFGGRPGERQVKEALPAALHALVERMVTTGLYSADIAPNHCLVNEYVKGNGIQPHQDGALYAPRVASITLEGSAVMDFYPVVTPHQQLLGEKSCNSSVLQVLLQPRGLLLMTGPAYNDFLHGIHTTAEDVITDTCCNLSLLSNVVGGETVPRTGRRKSFVFVHKKDSSASMTT